ncbi:MAG TPA: acyl-CoA dehydrogenase, partial [Burkholderiales bacterium]|nr:acyl-CoA dehydrogenase [Burkholderiales bacterium]
AARGTDLARVRRLRDSPVEYERSVWTQMAELGWLGVLVPEAHGGLGLGLAEAAIIAEGLARSLAPEPYTAAAVLSVEAVACADNETLKSRLLQEISSGATIAGLAWQERAGEGAVAIETRARPFEGGYRLNGEKRFIAGAAGADGYIVAARTDAQALALFWIDRNASGAVLKREGLADGRHFGTLVLSDVVVARENLLASEAVAGQALERALDHARVIASAELYGVMSRALEMTVEYLKTRVQFGKPIGSFQALQHRATDLYIQQQLASAALDHVIAALDEEPEPRRRSALASRAKARCSEAALTITRAAIQLHGAIGFTDEYDAGLYLKRAMVLAAWLGGATWHRRRYAKLALEESA